MVYLSKIRIWPFFLAACLLGGSLPGGGVLAQALKPAPSAPAPDKDIPSNRDDSDLRAARRKTPPAPNSPRGYRGLVLADLNPRNAFKDEIAADIGPLGIWVYEQMTWTQISGTDPDWIMTAALNGGPKQELIADLGARGLWTWTHDGYPGDWKQISGNDAEWAIALDDDNDKRQELHVVFGTPPGVWRYDETEGRRDWKQISSRNPEAGLRTALVPGGPEAGGYVFPGAGLWSLAFAGGEVQALQLSGREGAGDDHASAALLGGAAQDLAVDFGATGLWLCENTSKEWHQLSERSPDRLFPVRLGGRPRLVIDFNGEPGLYSWTYDGFPGTLTRLHPLDPDAGFCEAFERGEADRKNGNQQLAVDFGKGGLWAYDLGRRTWALINTKDPVFMASGDYWGLGFDSTLAVSFGADGLWLYEARSGNWFQISNNAPDSGL